MLLGVYQIPFGGVNNFCMKCVWGGHQIPLGGTSDTETPLKAAETLVFFAPKTS